MLDTDERIVLGVTPIDEYYGIMGIEIPAGCLTDCFLCGVEFENDDSLLRLIDTSGEEGGDMCPVCAGLPSHIQEHLLRARSRTLDWAYADFGWCESILRDILRSFDEDDPGAESELRKFAEFYSSSVTGCFVEAQMLRSYRIRQAPPVSTNGFVYLLGCPEGYCKIGRAKSLSPRLLQIGLQLPFKVELLHSVAVYDMVQGERSLHQRFKDQRLNGEWFSLSAQDIEWVRSLTTQNFSQP